MAHSENENRLPIIEWQDCRCWIGNQQPPQNIDALTGAFEKSTQRSGVTLCGSPDPWRCCGCLGPPLRGSTGNTSHSSYAGATSSFRRKSKQVAKSSQGGKFTYQFIESLFVQRSTEVSLQSQA